ncbi:MAG: hypothetical protein JWN03_2544 [Nocardia sp.]|nr:hypothetical protein [Nocardia sp.]
MIWPFRQRQLTGRFHGVTVLLVCVVLLVSAAAQAVTGSGFGLITAPILLVLAPQLVPGPLLVLTVAMTATGLLREYRHCDVRTVVFVSAAMLPGVAIGTAVLGTLDTGALRLVVASAAAVIGVFLLTGRTLPGSRRALTAAGVAAGFLAAVAAMPGPPLSLAYRPSNPAELRATLSAIFLIISVVSAAALAVQGQFTGADLRNAAIMSPMLLCGTVIGGRLARQLAVTHISRVTAWVILTAAAILFTAGFSG